MPKKKYYAVVRGKRPGIYKVWFGRNGAEVQVRGFPNALYRGFVIREAAEDYLKHSGGGEQTAHAAARPKAVPSSPSPDRSATAPKVLRTIVYTDGGCINNPGPGGWGAVVIQDNHRREISGGFRMTTNNRMELTACIMGLETLHPGDAVTIYTDSKYVANGITKGWAERWRANGWMRTKTERALNADLWASLLELCEKCRVEFVWVKGHAGVPENERCDQLAGRATLEKDLPPDTGYETG